MPVRLLLGNQTLGSASNKIMQHLIIEVHHDIRTTLYGMLQLTLFSLVELEVRLSASMRQASRLASTHATC
jgi:hypothetical protein